MRDIDLFARLWRRDAGAGGGEIELSVALGQLAERPFRDRAAFFHLVLPSLEAAEPGVRAAAVRVLAGARGIVGLRALVRALDDEHELVRRAAVEALRAAAREAPDRIAHALFHPRVDVRRATLSGPLPHGAEAYAAYLRADAACRDLTGASAWPARPLGLGLDLFLRDALSPDELVELLLGLTSPQLRAALEGEVARSPETVDAYLARVARARALHPAPGHDAFDLICMALAASPRRAEALRHLVDAVIDRKPTPLGRRLLVALLSHVAAQGLDAEAVAACVALEPRIIGYPFFPMGQAAAAARGLRAHGHRLRLSPARVARLLNTAPMIDGDRPNLVLAAAVASLLPGKRLAALEARFGVRAIVAAVADDAAGWEAVCALPRETPQRTVRWLGEVALADAARARALAARAVATWSGEPDRCREAIDTQPRADRAAIFLALCELLAESRLALTERRTETIVGAYAARLDRRGAAACLAALFRVGADELRHGLGLRLCRALAPPVLVDAFMTLEPPAQWAALARCDEVRHLDWEREVALAQALGASSSGPLRAWAGRILSTTTAEPEPVAPPLPSLRELNDEERRRIASCPEPKLEAALRPALDAPVRGLSGALAERPDPSAPHLAACAALVACGDALTAVAAQLDRFGTRDDGFAAKLDGLATIYDKAVELPPLALARLFRWERHKLRFAAWVGESGVRARLEEADALPGQLARWSLWRALADLMVFFRYREPARLQREASVELAEYLCVHLDGPVGALAARMLVAMCEARLLDEHLGWIRRRVLERAADTSAAAREYLDRIVNLRGVAEARGEATEVRVDERLLAKLRTSRELARLEEACADVRRAVVEEAVLRLLELGAAGEAVLVGLLPRVTKLAQPAPLLDSIPMWSEAALAAVRAAAGDLAAPPELRFHLALALAERGEPWLDAALAAAGEPSASSWFRRKDWERLCRRGSPLTCAVALAGSPHHHAHHPAVTLLLEHEGADAAVREGLRRFLCSDSARPVLLRRAAARALLATYGDPCGLPVLLEELGDHRERGDRTLLPLCPPEVRPAAAEILADMALVGGPDGLAERRLVDLLGDGELDGEVRARLYRRVLEEGSMAAARRTAAQLLSTEAAVLERLRPVAETFAWGVRRGLELTGRLFRIHMTAAEGELGYTYLQERRIFVSPLPLLRHERNGRHIVEGLILHELGHHMYHRGEAEDATWREARAEGLGQLLNLVADEHLERNLRALDADFGDRLKRLGAYAFQHAGHEVPVAHLLEVLRGAAAPALIATPLAVAFDPRSVRIGRGDVLRELEVIGHPLARFCRALRLGLGNRYGDPRVAEALALFDKGFRTLDMAGLLALTRRLAALFGGAVALAEIFGGSEGLVWEERDGDVFGAGHDDDLLQREIERILDPRGLDRQRGRGGNRLCINVSEEEAFDLIEHVERLRGDPAAYAELALEVRRHSRRLRAFLDELGLRWEPVGRRVQGRALDRARIRDLVVRNDPRILLARRPQRRTDLFLGVAIDCSGSMVSRDNIGRAKRFAVLLAEATRGLPGVDVRFFGFTDATLYDAGDQHDCAVAALRADGGNNDAAALYHVANLAAASRRKARVIVMISDGLPTESSVAALRALVTQLSRRRGLLCAQVAVQPLEEVCFPHYVVLDDSDGDVAVARFGRMIADLARRSLAP